MSIGRAGGVITEYQVRSHRAVAQEQTGQGPTYLLLHGAGGNHHSYDELLPHLSDRHVLVPALPGRCGSEGHAPRSVGEAAEWLLDFIAEASAGPLVICGHSYGGALAIEVALRGAERIEMRALVLMATGARLRVNPMILQMTQAAVAKGEPVSLAGFAFQDRSDSERIARIDAALRATPPEASDADWRAADAFDRMQDLAEIVVPTLVLTGTEDQLTPAKYARFMAETIPGATLSLVPGAGHMLPQENPAETARHIRQFMAQLPYHRASRG